MADEDAIQLLLHPAGVEVDRVDVDSRRGVKPLVAWAPERHAEIGPRRAAGRLDDPPADGQRDLAPRVDVDVDVRGIVRADTGAPARAAERDGFDLREWREERGEAAGELEMGGRHAGAV